MATNAEFVSRVLNGLKGLTKDDHISRRYVLSIGRNKATTYISQALANRTLSRESQLFKTIKCFELEKDDIVACKFVEFKRCNILMKSKQKLPKTISSKYGESILLVTSLDDGTEFDYSATSDALINNKRSFGFLAKNYYIREGYLYIPNYEVYAVNIDLLSLEEKEVAEASSCEECDECKSVWNYDFICPDKLYEPIINETIAEIGTTFKSIPEDENPNLDSNQKSQTVV